MSNLLNPENGFFTFMGKLCDMIMISLLYIILCLPLVFIGTSTTALYYSIVKVIRRERGYISRAFFHSFKINFKIGTIAGIINLIFGAIMYVDYVYAGMLKSNEASATMGTVFTIGFNIILILFVFTLTWLYPILSRFELVSEEEKTTLKHPIITTLRRLYKNSILIAIKHFPTTILSIAVTVGVFVGVYFFLPAVLIAPAVWALVSSFLIERVLKKYTPKQEGTPEETGIDEWYNE